MSTLAKFAHMSREPQPADARKAARDAYHKTGLVLINPDWLQSYLDRKQLEILAEKVHGRRK